MEEDFIGIENNGNNANIWRRKTTQMMLKIPTFLDFLMTSSGTVIVFIRC